MERHTAGISKLSMGTFDVGFQFDLLLSKGFWNCYNETQKVITYITVYQYFGAKFVYTSVNSSLTYLRLIDAFKTDHVRSNIARMEYLGRYPILPII